MQTWSSIWDHERQFKLPNSTCWIMKIKRHVPEFQTLKTWKLEPIVFFNYIRIPLTQNIWSLTVGFKLCNSTWFICWGCFPCPKKNNAKYWSIVSFIIQFVRYRIYEITKFSKQFFTYNTFTCAIVFWVVLLRYTLLSGLHLTAWSYRFCFRGNFILCAIAFQKLA